MCLSGTSHAATNPVTTCAAYLLLTKLGAATIPQEALGCAKAWADYYSEQHNFPVPFVGQAEFNATFPVASLPSSTTGVLTFEFIDPGTLNSVSGPGVGSVDYKVNIDPSSPGTFLDLGTSTSASSHFALPYTVSTGTEPLFEAIPLDRTGAPIVMTGAGGLNVAIGSAVNVTAAPEPADGILLGIGILGITCGVWLRRHRSRRGCPGAP
jgi:hypothetical protein